MTCVSRIGVGTAFGRVMGACAGLAAAGCSKPPPAYTLPAGTVDARPLSPYPQPRPDVPPWKGSMLDPNKGLGVQGFADKLIGARVADFVAHHVDYGHDGNFHYFYPAAGVGPGPGLCHARSYSPSWRARDEPPSGQWEDAYSVAGSVAPLPKPWPAGYRERLDSACRVRRDMAHWYQAPAGRAYAAALFADSVVASARRSERMPFKLHCGLFGSGSRDSARCFDVRKIVAAADPRAIAAVGDCRVKSSLPCLAVGLAKRPGSSSRPVTDQWVLNVRYRDDQGLRIVRVDVDDLRIDF